MSVRVIKLTIISDMICAFCYIGHKELQRAIAQCADLPVRFDIEYRPFRLSGIPEDGSVDKQSYFLAKMGQEKFENLLKCVSSWEETADANISFGGKLSQSTRAHRLSRKAYLIGGQHMQQSVLNYIFKAACEEQEDIGDIDLLADIAARAGVMSTGEAIEFLRSDELKPEIEEMIAEARSNGIAGVPFTVIDGKWAVGGGQSADVYVQIFRKLASTAMHAAPSPFASSVIEATA